MCCWRLLRGIFLTFFPYPITAQSTLRKQLGESLYLLASKSRMKLHGWLQLTKSRLLQLRPFYCSSPTKRNCRRPRRQTIARRRLDKVREAILGKELALFAQLRQHSASTAFEPTFGGKFPREQYDTIIQET